MSLKKILLMDVVDFFKGINRLFPKPVYHTKEEKKEIERKIVSRYHEGNISLFFGRYKTTEDIENMKKRILNHDFIPKNIY